MSDSDHKFEEIIARLNQQYGSPRGRKEDDTIHSLIKVILSQNTNDKNRDRAYRALLSEFESSEELLEADKNKISEVISVAGLQNKKATRILESLRTIKQKRKELDLSFLEDLSLSKARGWLLDLPGIGPKSAAVVLNFDFDKKAFPVDTHVFRVTKRLGLIPKNATRKSAHKLLEEQIPGEKMEEFHLNLIKHGREICKAPNPLCSECFLDDLCDYFLNEAGIRK